MSCVDALKAAFRENCIGSKVTVESTTIILAIAEIELLRSQLESMRNTLTFVADTGRSHFTADQLIWRDQQIDQLDAETLRDAFVHSEYLNESLSVELKETQTRLADLKAALVKIKELPKQYPKDPIACANEASQIVRTLGDIK